MGGFVVAGGVGVAGALAGRVGAAAVVAAVGAAVGALGEADGASSGWEHCEMLGGSQWFLIVWAVGRWRLE